MIKIGILSIEHPHTCGAHIPALEMMQDRVKVVAMYNPDLDALRPWAELFKADMCRTKEELLAREDIQAVLITSPNASHVDDAVMAARAGKDIFCDKPISLNAEQSKRLYDEIEACGVKYLTTFPVRFNPSLQKIKRQIEDGEFGRIVAILATNHGCAYDPGAPDWVYDIAVNGGGCIIDHTVHVADIIRWLTGSEFKDVKAVSTNMLREIPAEDLAVMHGHLENGVVFQIDPSWSRRGENPMWGDVTFRIIGTEGSARLDLYNNQRIDIFDSCGMNAIFPNSLTHSHGEVFLDYYRVKEGLSEDYVGADHVDGIRAVELVEAAYASVKSGQYEPVRIYKG